MATMSMADNLSTILINNESSLLSIWLDLQLSSNTLRPDLINEKDLRQQSQEFIRLFFDILHSDPKEEMDSENYYAIREFLINLSQTNAMRGFTTSETATFIFSLKHAIYSVLGISLEEQSKKEFVAAIWRTNVILDKLGLYTIEIQQANREEIIKRQQEELMELSTPVVKLWQGIIMLPLIGTLDSARTQQVMENLLQSIVDYHAEVAIIDITGIPMVDTMVAQHLIKTISAARLMGAECIISGIRPQIAQTMVHLGISLHQVITKATLSDALSLAIERNGYQLLPTAAQK
jgi:rsbT co-antagonist protein RsbR